MMAYQDWSVCSVSEQKYAKVGLQLMTSRFSGLCDLSMDNETEGNQTSTLTKRLGWTDTFQNHINIYVSYGDCEYMWNTLMFIEM